jgi:hypothetical protein
MDSTKSKKIHALEFECGTPLKFFEQCHACPRFENCPDLSLGQEILRGKKKVNYHEETGLDDSVDVRSFGCLVPFNYFEKTRIACGHQGRCREEGLLLALLSGKKELDYAQKRAVPFPKPSRLDKKVRVREKEAVGMAV